MTQNKYNLWLANIDSISFSRVKTLLTFFDNAESVYRATENMLKSTKLDFVDKIIETKEPDYYLEILEKKNIQFTSILNEDYPSQLKDIYNPPVGLYMAGRLSFSDLEKNNVAIVGSRQCSDYGIATTVSIAKYLASKNIQIISGMATGIDTYAHKGVLEANGITIAVLGCGVDVCYPKNNFALYEKIKQTGAIISEYASGIEPRPFHFPMRNRIISGLSVATVVVEAGLKSGSLITADCALEQGKDIFAVPGNINSKLSSGTNNLIKQGAYLLTDPEEILEILNIGNVQQVDIAQIIEETQNNQLDLTPEEKIIFDCVGKIPIEIDEIHRQTILNIQNLNYNLTILELKGILMRLPGNKYVRSKS